MRSLRQAVRKQDCECYLFTYRLFTVKSVRQGIYPALRDLRRRRPCCHLSFDLHVGS